MKRIKAMMCAGSGVVVGLFAGMCLVVVSAQDAGNTGNEANDPAPATAATPVAPKVAYVDFLECLKNDYELRREQARINNDLDVELRNIDREYRPKIEKQQDEMKTYQPDTKEYKTAMRRFIEFRRRYNELLLSADSGSQMDVRDEGVKAFKRMRNRVKVLAEKRGYDSVLNILRDPDSMAEAQQDFRALQQQLLISPVMYFDPAHDLTDEIITELKANQPDYKIEVTTVKTADGETLVKLPKDDNAPEGTIQPDYEIELGATISISTKVTDRGNDAKEKEQSVAWRRLGIRTGDFNDDVEGEYTAPDEMPESGEMVTLRGRLKVDPSAMVEIVVRLKKPAEQPGE